MRYPFFALILMLISSCTATHSYYHLTSTDKWKQYGSACSGAADSYDRELSNGVRINLGIYRRTDHTDLFITFLVAKEKFVKLEHNEIAVRVPEVKNEKTYLIDKFESGRDLSGFNLKAKPSLIEFQVATLSFGPTDLLVGLGRFAHNPVGESSDDKYQTIVKIPGSPVDKMVIEFPPILVNGQRYLLAPLALKYSQSTSFLCFQ